jgi:multimeric flavodoxin WrbA
MQVIAVNGSPRKKWNTATLLRKALDGSASRDAAAELVHLYDIDFKGCISCFACKTKNGKSYGRCAVKDDLAPLLERIAAADVLILGSPVYLGTATGEMRSFLERLLFPYLTYTDPPGSIFPGKLRTAFIYTLGADEAMAKARGFVNHFALNEIFLKIVFGNTETLCSYDTCQFDDYAKYDAPRWNPEAKAKRRAEVFPEDCAKAYALGARLAGGQV